MSVDARNMIGPSIHPGEILDEEFLQPMGITQSRLARDLKVTPIRISQIIHGKRAITADTALRLGRYFGTTAQFWLNMQAQYDLESARDQIAGVIETIAPRKSA